MPTHLPGYLVYLPAVPCNRHSSIHILTGNPTHSDRCRKCHTHRRVTACFFASHPSSSPLRSSTYYLIDPLAVDYQPCKLFLQLVTIFPPAVASYTHIINANPTTPDFDVSSNDSRTLDHHSRLLPSHTLSIVVSCFRSAPRLPTTRTVLAINSAYTRTVSRSAHAHRRRQSPPPSPSPSRNRPGSHGRIHCLE